MIIELRINETSVGIKRKNLMLLNEYKKLGGGGSSKRKSRSRSKEVKRSTKDEKYKKLKWVLPGIIVRVISKKIEGGKLYNKKMRVVDVLS